MDKSDGTQFFDNEQEVYLNYLKITNQKDKTAESIARGVENLLPNNRAIEMLCVGGGTGEADLNIITKLKKHFFSVTNIDPSAKFKDIFESKMYEIDNAKLSSNFIDKFESVNIPQKSFDFILSVNSIYFLKNWKDKQESEVNPLMKIYNSLKGGGVAAIVLKSNQGDHYKIKKLAGAGNTCGESVRTSLSFLKISHYWETIYANIDVSDLFGSKSEWAPNKEGNQLLSFLSKGKWKDFSDFEKSEMKNLIISLVKEKSGKLYIESRYELIWIHKKNVSKQNDLIDLKINFLNTKKLEKKIRPIINVVPDFPVKDVFFRDTTSLLRNSKAFGEVIDYAADIYSGHNIDLVIAKDMQGVLWAGAIANKLNVGVVPTFRKDITPPYLTTVYSHEYNPNRILNLQTDAIKRGQNVLIVDYIIATGATVLNMSKLIEHLGGNLVGVFSLMELCYLKPRDLLQGLPIHSVIKYEKPHSH